MLGAYQQCCFTPDYWRSYTVIGDAGRMENVGDSAGAGEVLVWNRRRHGFDAVPDLRIPLTDAPSAGTRAPVCEGRPGAHDAAMLADFAAAVLDGAAPRTSARTARDVVAAGVLARRSIHGGGGLLPVPAPAGA